MYSCQQGECLRLQETLSWVGLSDLQPWTANKIKYTKFCIIIAWSELTIKWNGGIWEEALENANEFCILIDVICPFSLFREGTHITEYEADKYH